MHTERPAYLSYLLRLWRAPGGADQPWRASLQDTLTGERTGFADLEALCAYLHAQIETVPAPGGEPGDVVTIP
ncbi:MAG TPA: hypothetical protein VL334_14075 [Anaerolineae bacterium]|nr:hypothetical protein [Anaerolineae bacterium]